MNNLEVLKAARELLSDPKRRTNHVLARNCFGIPTDPADPNAVTFDLMGAISKFCKSREQEQAVFEMIDRASGVVVDLADLNDNYPWSHVDSILDKAITEASQCTATAPLFKPLD